MTDWCAEAVRLRTVREQIITGTHVVRVRFDTEETEFGKADLGRLDALISEAEANCAIANGTVTRRRAARTMRFRPTC